MIADQKKQKDYDFFVLLQLSSKQQNSDEDIRKLFLKKFKSYPSKNVKIIRSDLKLDEEKNKNSIFKELDQIFNSNTDVYIFYCGQANYDGDLLIQSLNNYSVISYQEIAMLWMDRKNKLNEFFLFLDCNNSGKWCNKNNRKNIANKMAIFANSGHQSKNNHYRGLFFKIILSLEEEDTQQAENFFFQYYDPKVSSNRQYQDLSRKHLTQLKRQIEGVKNLIHLPSETYQSTQLKQMYKIFNQQPTKEQEQKSIEIKKKLIAMAQSTNKNNQQSSIPLLVLSQMLERDSNNKGTAKVIFHQESNQKTKKTLEALSSFLFYKHLPIVQQVIKNDQYKYTYQEISREKKKYQQYRIWFKNYISKKYEVPSESVEIVQITKGSICTKYNIKVQKLDSGQLKIHQFFKYFHLTPGLFCTQGNKVYGFSKDDYQYGKIDWRGGWPYFLPVKCKRYGLNVRGNYDEGNDSWLQMDGKPGQWAIAFHGVKSPQNISKISNNKECFNSMMSGLGKGKNVFKVTTSSDKGNHAYKSDISANTNQKIGQGIYCTPQISTAVGYACNGVKVKKNNKQEVYHLVFMCRVNPKKILVCPNIDYYVIKSPQDIRPYGVILIKEEVKRNFPSSQQLYNNDAFSWERYGEKIKQNLTQDK